MREDVTDYASVDRHLLSRAAHLRCVQRSPGVFTLPYAINYDNDARMYFDRRVTLSCREWSFLKGDSATAVAFAMNENGEVSEQHLHWNVHYYVAPGDNNTGGTIKPHL